MIKSCCGRKRATGCTGSEFSCSPFFTFCCSSTLIRCLVAAQVHPPLSRAMILCNLSVRCYQIDAKYRSRSGRVKVVQPNDNISRRCNKRTAGSRRTDRSQDYAAIGRSCHRGDARESPWVVPRKRYRSGSRDGEAYPQSRCLNRRGSRTRQIPCIVVELADLGTAGHPPRVVCQLSSESAEVTSW